MSETDEIVEVDPVGTGQTSNDAAKGKTSEDGASSGESSDENGKRLEDASTAKSSDKNEESPDGVPPPKQREKASKDEIVKKLEVDEELPPAIVLTGEAGIGKTWMAKAVSDAVEEKQNNCYGTIWISLDQKHTRQSLYADIARQFSLLTSADEWDDEENTVVDKKEEEEEDEEKEKQMDPIDKALRKMLDRHIVQTKEEEKDRGKVDRCKYLLWVLDEGFKMRKTKEELDEEKAEADRAKAEAEAKAAAAAEEANKKAVAGPDYVGSDKEKANVEPEQDQVEADAKQDQRKSESSDNKPDLSLLQQVLMWRNTRILITTGRDFVDEIFAQILAKPLVSGKLVYRHFSERRHEYLVVPRLSSKEEVSELLKARAKKHEYLPASTVEDELNEAIAGKEFLPADIILMLGALNCIAEQHLTRPLPPEELKWKADSVAMNAAQDPNSRADSTATTAARDPNSKADSKLATAARDPNSKADSKVATAAHDPNSKADLKVATATQDPNSKADSKVATPDQVKNLKETLKKVIHQLVKAEGDSVKELVLCALEALQANDGMAADKPKAESVMDRFLHKWDVFRARGKEDNKYIKLIKLEEIRAKEGMVETKLGLSNNKTKARSVIDCFWHGRDFFKARRGGVHYNELISYWILEGCFEPVDDLKPAYQKGHDVLMKLVDYGMIRLQEDNGIYMEGLDLDIHDCRFNSISATANLRMARMLEETKKWRGFGRITPADGMIKTLRIGDKKTEELVSTILVDGSGIHSETPEQLFLRTQNLNALGMFDAMLSDPTYSIKAKTHKTSPSDQQKTSSDQPSSKAAITATSNQSNATIADTSSQSKAAVAAASDQSNATVSAPSDQSNATVSAPSDQPEASDAAPSDQPKATDAAPSDQHKAADAAPSNQSDATVSVPSDQTEAADAALSNQPEAALKASTKNLQVLVFRRCYLLNSLDFIQQMETLTALEVSGAVILKTIPDKLFEKTTQLRSLNFSELGVESLPTTLSNLSKLQRLILRNCSRLRTLPAIRNLIDLEVVDLNGCCSLEKMADMCLKSLPNLEILDLSYTRLQRMPIINSLDRITQVLLKGCDNIGAMRKLKGLINLKHLNISGVNKVREIHEDFLEGTDKIEVVDLSGTGIERLPPFKNPRVLNLKGCSKLSEPPNMEGTCLEFLDLSDASVLKSFKNESFEHLKSLQHMNLSNTKLEKLPSLNGLSKLEQLLLEGCSSLEELPEMKGLSGLKVFKLKGCTKLKSLPDLTDYVNLEELDLSGCEALSEVPAFQHQELLQKLNLSKTQIKSLSSLSGCGKLQSLILRNCTNLESLEVLQYFSELEELDLLDASMSEDVKAEYFKNLTKLQILRLPKITAEELSKISILSKVNKLSLYGCSGDASWPALEGLQELEISDDAAGSLTLMDKFRGLRKLSLRGKRWTELPSLESLVHLESLDLSGTGIGRITDEISKLLQLKCLRVPRLDLVLENDCWEKLTCRSIYIDCEDWEGSLPDGKKPYIMVRSTEFFDKLKDSKKLTGALDRINFSVHSSKMQAGKGNSKPDNWYDIQSEIRKFPPPEGRCLEIQGFDSYPAHATFALKEAECVSLVDNKFLSCISDLFAQMRNSIVKDENNSIPEANESNLHFDIQEKMTSCWLERCTKVTSIYKDPYTVMKVEKKLRFAVNLKILRISSLLNLKSFYDGEKEKCFENLEELYIDSCPMLEIIFSSEQSMSNLHTLKIESCGSLMTVFGQKELIQKTDGEKAEGEQEEEAEGEAEAEPEKVVMQYASAPKLNKLYISRCSMLETVYSSDQLPGKMDDVDIKFCDELQSVFGNKDSRDAELEVGKMRLSNLPKLTTVGVKLQNCTPVVSNCLKLNSQESKGTFEEITEETEEITE